MELGRAFKAEAARCLEAAGGKVDYRREWEGLDREMFRRCVCRSIVGVIHVLSLPLFFGAAQLPFQVFGKPGGKNNPVYTLNPLIVLIKHVHIHVHTPETD